MGRDFYLLPSLPYLLRIFYCSAVPGIYNGITDPIGRARHFVGAETDRPFKRCPQNNRLREIVPGVLQKGGGRIICQSLPPNPSTIYLCGEYHQREIFYDPSRVHVGCTHSASQRGLCRKVLLSHIDDLAAEPRSRQPGSRPDVDLSNHHDRSTVIGSSFS